MDRDAIKKTAVCRWDNAEECFIVESPLFSRVIGAAETEKEAWALYYELLHETYQDYQDGKLAGYSKPGRPAKGNAQLTTKIRPATKEGLAHYAADLNISIGEMIDYLFMRHEADEAAAARKALKGRKGI